MSRPGREREPRSRVGHPQGRSLKTPAKRLSEQRTQKSSTAASRSRATSIVNRTHPGEWLGGHPSPRPRSADVRMRRTTARSLAVTRRIRCCPTVRDDGVGERATTPPPASAYRNSTRRRKSMATGVDIRRWACVVFCSYRERQRRSGAGDDGTTREVRQDGQTARKQARNRLCVVTRQYRDRAVRQSKNRRSRRAVPMQDAGGERAPARLVGSTR